MSNGLVGFSFVSFRDGNDKIHYFGSMNFSLVLFLILMGFLQYKFEGILAIASSSYLISFVSVNFLGLIWESLENWIFVHWKNEEYWKSKPGWMHKHFSGDDWDWHDILLNFLGSTILHPVFVLIRDLLRRKQSR